MLRLLPLAMILASATSASAGVPHVGAMVEVGVPAGAGAALVLRPVRALRIHAGAAHDGIGPGVTAGVALAPLGGVVTPTLDVEAGRFFAHDASDTVMSLVGAPGATGALGYDFASAHLGLEFGGCFFLRGGVSVVRGALSTSSSTTVDDVAFHGVVASGELGFVLYL